VGPLINADNSRDTGSFTILDTTITINCDALITIDLITVSAGTGTGACTGIIYSIEVLV
jgi:hypothetical protein